MRNLTFQQIQELIMLSYGIGEQESADAQGVSKNTVHSKRALLYRNLGVHSAGHAIRRGFEEGILTTDNQLHLTPIGK